MEGAELGTGFLKDEAAVGLLQGGDAGELIGEAEGVVKKADAEAAAPVHLVVAGIDFAAAFGEVAEEGLEGEVGLDVEVVFDVFKGGGAFVDGIVEVSAMAAGWVVSAPALALALASARSLL